MEMRTELKRLHLETHSTFVYVTHDQLEAMTLSTRVCLLKKGILQQYSPPLEIYGQPANIFVADFVGNPSVNLVDFVCDETTSGGVALHNDDLKLLFKPNGGELTIPEGKKLILGLRPETIAISENGAFRGRVYSSLPSGMETIVRLTVGSTPLLSVVFGSIDFKVDEDVSFNLGGNHYMLFDGDSGERISLGRLSGNG